MRTLLYRGWVQDNEDDFNYLSIALEFTSRDMWIGVYSKVTQEPLDTWFDIWICVIPCFPIHISQHRARP